MDPQKISEMMRQAQAMQQQMQETLLAQRVEGQAGGGMLKVTMNGAFEVLRVQIDPAVVDPADVAMLEDLIRAACNDAVTRAEELRVQHARGMVGQLGVPPGLF